MLTVMFIMRINDVKGTFILDGGKKSKDFDRLNLVQSKISIPDFRQNWKKQMLAKGSVETIMKFEVLP